MNIKTETVNKIKLIKKIINNLDKYFQNPNGLDEDINILRGLLSKVNINLKELKNLPEKEIIKIESNPDIDSNDIKSLSNEIEILTKLLYEIESKK